MTLVEKRYLMFIFSFAFFCFSELLFSGLTFNFFKYIFSLLTIITLFESQIILAGHESCTNWGDCKSNKSNQVNIYITLQYLHKSKKVVLGTYKRGQVSFSERH